MQGQTRGGQQNHKGAYASRYAILTAGRVNSASVSASLENLLISPERMRQRILQAAPRNIWEHRLTVDGDSANFTTTVCGDEQLPPRHHTGRWICWGQQGHGPTTTTGMGWGMGCSQQSHRKPRTRQPTAPRVGSTKVGKRPARPQPMWKATVRGGSRGDPQGNKQLGATI